MVNDILAYLLIILWGYIILAYQNEKIYLKLVEIQVIFCEAQHKSNYFENFW